MPPRPRFSIIMPTRNRPQLLRLSLQSALELRGHDYEVVVSDNCSTSETREVVEEIGDSRVRYVRTPRPLSLTENMEFALGWSRGEYVTFLNDDDALVARTLESAREILEATEAEIVAWPFCHYYYPDWHEIRHRNSLVAARYSSELEHLYARDTVTAAYRNLDVHRLPTSNNGLCQRALIDRVKRRVPRLFPGFAGDVFAGVLLMAEARAYHWVDIPFTILGRWPRSLGSSLFARRGSSGSEYFAEFPDDTRLQYVPLRALTATNIRADALLGAKAVLDPEVADTDLDWERYFVLCHRDLLYQHVQGGDVRGDLEDWKTALENQPASVRESVIAGVREGEHDHRHSLRASIRRVMNQIPLLGWTESILRSTLSALDGGVVLQGSRAGFTNILECARAWDRFVSTPSTTTPNAVPLT